eukprot:gene23660-9191_t
MSDDEELDAMGALDALADAANREDFEIGGRRAHNMKSGFHQGPGVRGPRSSLQAMQKWAQCSKCTKWRKIPSNVNDEELTDEWECKDNVWDKAFQYCHIEQEVSNKEIDRILSAQAPGKSYDGTNYDDDGADDNASLDEGGLGRSCRVGPPFGGRRGGSRSAVRGGRNRGGLLGMGLPPTVAFPMRSLAYQGGGDDDSGMGVADDGMAPMPTRTRRASSGLEGGGVGGPYRQRSGAAPGIGGFARGGGVRRGGMDEAAEALIGLVATADNGGEYDGGRLSSGGGGGGLGGAALGGGLSMGLRSSQPQVDLAGSMVMQRPQYPFPRAAVAPGKVVWAKVEGHDWWPAKVVRRRAVPREVISPPGGPPMRGCTPVVFFFSSNGY